MAAIICQAGIAVGFDYNYKVHLFYIFVDLFKHMTIYLILKHY